MIIVTAHLWPNGSQAESREILNVSLTNQSSPGDARESYIGHVIARPDPEKGVIGYDADVAVHGHVFHHGFTPVLVAALCAAHSDTPDLEAGISIPPAQSLARVVLQQMEDFEARLKGR